MGANRTEVVLQPEIWRPRAEAHRTAVDDLIGPYLQARRHGARHPVIDFLFTYYSSRPAHLRRWHPGHGVGLRDAREYRSLPGYTVDDAIVVADPTHLADMRPALRRTHAILTATAGRPVHLGCFGLHEWAMVYRTDRPRHNLPLRLGQAGTDTVVESMPLRCTHFDAFRFFTEAARPRNATTLRRDDQIATEQPGCLHASMDLYRACLRAAPHLPSDLLLEAFRLALDARELDMRASPYDLTGLGYSAVPVETASGRAEYTREQSVIAERGTLLRARVLEGYRSLLSLHESDDV